MRSVKESVLENKTEKELEEYIEEGNRFVPEASLLAFEILKSRGREFSELETQRIMSLISEKSKIPEKVIHPNYKKAADLIYLSAALGVINEVLSSAIFNNSFEIGSAVLSLGIIIGIGYSVSKGNDWIKYVLLALMILGLISIRYIILNIAINPVVSIINLIQTVLQIYSIVLLFKIPTSKKNNNL